MLVWDEYQPPVTLSMDQKRIVAVTENIYENRDVSPSSFSENNGKGNIPDNAVAENFNKKVSLENDEEWSNDSDIYIEDADSDVTDTKSEIKSNVRSKLG